LINTLVSDLAFISLSRKALLQTNSRPTYHYPSSKSSAMPSLPKQLLVCPDDHDARLEDIKDHTKCLRQSTAAMDRLTDFKCRLLGRLVKLDTRLRLIDARLDGINDNLDEINDELEETNEKLDASK